jgi:hypothetical protein
MNPISLFPAYSQSENRVTNYVGLALKLIYEESPAQFQNWLASILPESEGLVVGPLFRQQAKGEKGIADLVIRQTGFSIAVETKLQDWHYSEQLKRHIEDLGAQGTRALLALANFEHDHPESRHEDAMRLAQEAKVAVIFMSYEELLQSLSNLNLSARLVQTIDELQAFLDQSGLLPVWKYLLDVVNCGGTQNEIHLGAYLCPHTGGPYSHRRAKYLGTYFGKRVNSIHQVRALVTVGIDQKPGQVLWNNSEETEQSLVAEALGILKQCDQWRIDENKSKELQVFLLEQGYPTNFKKEDAGGMMQSKKYFWNIALVLKADDAKALAAKLDGRTWSEF